MRAADTTRESVSSDQQLNGTKSGSDCQDREPYRNTFAVDGRGIRSARPSVLLLDSDLNHAEGLTRSLHAAAYVVTTCSDIRSTLRTLSRCNFDILILSSYRAGEWKTYIDHIQKITRKRHDAKGGSTGL